MSKRSSPSKSKQKRPANPQMRQQIRHPISQLPLFTKMIDEGLANAEEQYATFAQAKDRPHILDDALVNRAIRAYETQIADLKLFEQQFAWWQEENLTGSQRQQVADLLAKLPRIKERATAILGLLAELQKGTIERVLAQDEVELGVEFLLGKSKLTGKEP